MTAPAANPAASSPAKGALLPFVGVAVVFAIPVLLKAFLLPLYLYACANPAPELLQLTVSQLNRLLLPVFLIGFGYLIFVLEGAQSSVMLANKQSSETLDVILNRIDISNETRDRTKKALSKIVGGVPIDNFFIGRQLLMVAFTFMFKFCYDSAQLSAAEKALLAVQTTCTTAQYATLTTYGILDYWLASTFLCAVIVAYFFQVPSKLMAQHYPMRFLTTVPLTKYAPIASQTLGAASLLGRPVSYLRARAAERLKKNEFSYFSGREHSPLSTKDVFDALADLYGEYIREISITLTPQSPEQQNVWFVKDDTIYEVVRPSRDFSQTIQVPGMLNLNYEISSQTASGSERKLPLKIKPVTYNIASAEGGTNEVLTRVRARFESDQPKGTNIIWNMNYLTPVIMTNDEHGIPSRIFEIHIKKPVEKVVFRVAALPCEDLDVKISPVDGAESPNCSSILLDNSTAAKGVAVRYPSIGSKLVVRF